jgi:hypothetical protein
MRLSALTVPALLLALGSCATSENNDQQFVQPNQLIGNEIESRVANIPLQHREDLLQNLLWLSQQGEQAIGGLMRGMQHQDPKVRSSCSWTLGRIGDRRVVSHLRPYMRDPNETVRLEVARTLLTLGDMDAVPELVGALDSNKKEVRYLCHEALKNATGRDFGFDHLSEDVAQRRVAVLGWRQWWSEYAKDPWFAQSYAREHNVTAQPAAPGGETADPLSPTQSPRTQEQDPLMQEPVRRTPSVQAMPPGTSTTPNQTTGTQTTGQSPEQTSATGTTPTTRSQTTQPSPTTSQPTETTPAQEPTAGTTTPTQPTSTQPTSTQPTSTTGGTTTPARTTGTTTGKGAATGTSTTQKPATGKPAPTTPTGTTPTTGTTTTDTPTTGQGSSTTPQTDPNAPRTSTGSSPNGTTPGSTPNR